MAVDSPYDGAVRTETEKGTNVGTYDAAMRTEAEKDAAGGGPQTIGVGLVTENESLFSLTAVPGGISQSVGLVTENESLFSLTVVPGGISQSVGLVTENESLFGPTAVPGIVSQSVGLVTENESLFAATVTGITATRTGTPSQVNASAAVSGSTGITVPADCTAVIATWEFWNTNAGENMSSLSIDSDDFIIHENRIDGSPDDTSAVGVAVLVNPSTGAQSLSWAWSGGSARDDGGGIILTYVKNVNTSNLVRDSGFDAQVFGNNAELTINSASTDLVLSAASSSQQPPAISGTVYLDNIDVNNIQTDAAEQVAGSSTTTTTMTNESFSTIVSISLRDIGDTGINQSVGLVTENESLFSPTAVPGAISQSVGLVTENESLFSVTGEIFSPFFEIILSPHVPTGGIDTTDRLTGGNTHDGGRLQDDKNPADSVNLAADRSGEYAWVLGTAGTTPGDQYSFRLVLADGTLLDNYGVEAKWTISSGTVSVGLVTENESLFSLTAVPGGVSVSVGLLTENESLFGPTAVPGGVSQSVGLVTENESLFSPTAVPGIVAPTVGLVTENESLFSLTAVPGAISQSVGLVTENESLFGPAVKFDQSIAVGLVTENESLFGPTPVPGAITQSVGLLTENESLFGPTAVPGGLSQVVGLLTENESLFAVTLGAVSLGGIFNAIGYLPTGGVVTIALINVETDAVIPLDDNSCVESNTIPGVYLWDSAKLTTQPATDVQYGWRMTDGTNFDGGDIVFDEATVLKIVEIWRRLALDKPNPLRNKKDGSIQATGIDIVATEDGDDIIQTRQ